MSEFPDLSVDVGGTCTSPGSVGIPLSLSLSLSLSSSQQATPRSPASCHCLSQRGVLCPSVCLSVSCLSQLISDTSLSYCMFITGCCCCYMLPVFLCCNKLIDDTRSHHSTLDNWPHSTVKLRRIGRCELTIKFNARTNSSCFTVTYLYRLHFNFSTQLVQ